MNNSGKDIEIIFAPRSLGIFLIQYMSIAPLGTVLIILVAVISSGASIIYRDLLILFLAFILPLLLIAFIMLYIPNKYITRYIFDGDKKLLLKIKRKTKTEQFDLELVRSIVSKTIKTNPGCKYNLIFEENGENLRTIINEDSPFGAGHWEAFSEKLSKTTGLQLRKEYWVEDLGGNLSLIPHEDRIASRKHGILILCIPLALSIAGAIGYRIAETFQALLLIGVSVVLINIGLSFVYVLFNRDKFGDWAGNHFTLIVYILTLSIPYTIFYLFFVFALNGFRLPAGF
jgi:hypothetical protein